MSASVDIRSARSGSAGTSGLAHGEMPASGHASPAIITTVDSETTLDAAIAAAIADGQGTGAITIGVVGSFSLASAITEIDLRTRNSLTIAGSNGAGGALPQTIDGGGAWRGLYVYAGAVTIKNLALNAMIAQGAPGGALGGGGGGGGAGLGGALFITGSSNGVGGSSVTLDNVTFSGDAAIGGKGGLAGTFGSGGYGGSVFGSGGASGSQGGGGGNGGFGGGGGGAGPGGVGGAGGAGGPNPVGTGGTGGTGGLGGNGGAAGKGGFGAGAGVAGGPGRQGGARNFGSSTGSGGPGGAAGAGGGGGLGAGGDIFVQQGGKLVIEGGTLAAGAVDGGAGAGGATGGAAYGSGVFIEGDQTLDLSPPAGQTLTIDGGIADMTGSNDASGQTGAGAVVMNGAGTVVLAGDNTFTGGLRIAASETVELAATGAGGLGLISGAGTLALTGGTQTFNAMARLTVAKVSQAIAATVASVTSNLGYSGVWTLAAGTMSVASGATLNFLGSGDVLAGTLAGAGTVAFRAGTDTLTATTLTAAHIDADGAKVTVAGVIVNDGAVSVSGGEILVAAAGATVTGIGTVTMSPLARNELTGATAASTLAVFQTLRGGGELGGGQMTLIVGASGIVEATGGVALSIDTGAKTIINAGVIETLGSGGATIASAIGNSGELISHAATMTLNGAVNNAGELYADAGDLTVNGAVSGTGLAEVYRGTLDFTAASTFKQDVTFVAGASGTLELGHSQDYAATISGFARTGATVLDLTDIAYVSGTTKASYVGTATGGVLTINSGTEIAHIHFAGNYTASVWTLSAAAGGGVSIVDPTMAPAHGFAQTLAGVPAARAGAMAVADIWRSPSLAMLATPGAR